MKKQGAGLRHGLIPQLDRKIYNNYAHAPAMSKRYMTVGKDHKVRYFKNLSLARIDVVKNFTSRREVKGYAIKL